MRIPNATYRHAKLLNADVPVQVADTVGHPPIPGAERIVLGRTPPVTGGVETVERTTIEATAATVATQRGRKTGQVII